MQWSFQAKSLGTRDLTSTYQQHHQTQGVGVVSSSSNGINTASLLFHVHLPVVATPSSCGDHEAHEWICQQNSTAISRSANQPETLVHKYMYKQFP